MDTILEILAPVLSVLLTILVTAAVPALFRWMQKLGLDVEAKHREALQSALTSAGMLALTKGSGVAGGRAAIEYVRQSVPDAVAKFGLDDRRIAELLLPKITEAKVQAGQSPQA